MKKDRSKTVSSKHHRFTLPKNKILSGRSNFDNLFEETAAIYHAVNLSTRFCIYKAEEWDYKMAFIVPARLGNAVLRNRIKRLLKESFRQRQFIVRNEISTSSHVLHAALIAKTVQINFETVEAEVINLLTQMREYIHNFE